MPNTKPKIAIDGVDTVKTLTNLIRQNEEVMRCLAETRIDLKNRLTRAKHLPTGVPFISANRSRAE